MFYNLFGLTKLLLRWLESSRGINTINSVQRDQSVASAISSLRAVGVTLTGQQPSSDAIAAALAALLA